MPFVNPDICPLVAVVVYTRFHNLRVWVRCWNECKRAGFDFGAKFLVIHNHDYRRPKTQAEKICVSDGGVDWYVPRHNRGVDIGAFQDLATSKLKYSSPLSSGNFEGALVDLGDWNTLFWAADDALPMRKDFLYHFLNAVHEPGIGAAGPEVSTETSYHLRTNCFCIKREDIGSLKFPRTPMLDKAHAHDFEHRKYNMATQLAKRGLAVKQINPDIAYAVWDTGHRRYLNRWQQHFQEFPSSREVLERLIERNEL